MLAGRLKGKELEKQLVGWTAPEERTLGAASGLPQACEVVLKSLEPSGFHLQGPQNEEMVPLGSQVLPALRHFGDFRKGPSADAKGSGCGSRDG